jgi:hypothetical protein
MFQLHILHYLWRHAYGLTETRPNRITLGIWYLLDAWHDRFAYQNPYECRCTRFPSVSESIGKVESR